MVAVSVISFGIALAHGPTDKFLYDAAEYWAGANALVTGGNAFEAGFLTLRGVMSAVVYVPASVGHLLLGGSPFVAVLVQNALLIAVLGTFLIPRIVGLLGNTDILQQWVSAVLCSVLLSGFAPYPLLDLWALALVLFGIVLVTGRRSPALLTLSGVILAVAINLRPAYLAPVALAGIVWAIFFWRNAYWPAIGGVLGLLPQIITNAVFTGSWKPWPSLTSKISEIQAQYAAFTVRYDTVAYVATASPRQFSCSPVMANAIGDIQPKGSAEVLAFFAGSLPDSLLFMSQKVAASLNWTVATPYSGLPSSRIGLLAVLVALVSSAGVLALIRHLATRQSSSPLVPMLLLAIWLGSLATLVASTPESRFSLPIVMIGVIGAVSGLASPLKRPLVSPASIAWVEGAIILAILLLWTGSVALSHPAPPGDATAAICRLS